ncbi:hypothetical protein IGS74_13600 [Aureimonas sp. OT7]|uniref:hypothetical protein n=1 Tax=Aureimonas TaxID=414371 RepID=UPI00177BEC2C|nr:MULTISPECIES: hypothetical protein [Aureimonas]QOG05627.1 hypothetical protein IGS74_13600 [Aureimonas sp. OT7]
MTRPWPIDASAAEAGAPPHAAWTRPSAGDGPDRLDRDHAQAVRFVTGHSQKGALPELDCSCLADAATTTIFYMAVRTAGDLAERLIASGAPPDMPAVVASALTRPCEKIWMGSLLSLPDAAADIRLDQPVLINIGSVFGARVKQLSTGHDPIMEPRARIRLS